MTNLCKQCNWNWVYGRGDPCQAQPSIAIPARVLERPPLRLRGLHRGASGSASGSGAAPLGVVATPGPSADSAPCSPSCLLDLSLDSSGEWDALEARESIAVVDELADLLLADLLASAGSCLKSLHNSRSSSLFQEQLISAQLLGDSHAHRRGRANRRSPIKF